MDELTGTVEWLEKVILLDDDLRARYVADGKDLVKQYIYGVEHFPQSPNSLRVDVIEKIRTILERYEAFTISHAYEADHPWGRFDVREV